MSLHQDLNPEEQQLFEDIAKAIIMGLVANHGIEDLERLSWDVFELALDLLQTHEAFMSREANTFD